MSQSFPTVVVVLGMHRSGTSAITRGLEVLGVDLGANLMQGIPGNNDKGFFEDLDVYRLNNEILQALEHTWHTWAHITVEDLTVPAMQAFRLRAVELIRAKTSGVAMFGLKDPRICRLLPFWQDAFRHINARVSYVIAIRNPLSVAASLFKRDGIDPARSHYLWLEHTLTAVTFSDGSNRVIVDFDILMANPVNELARVGRCIGRNLSTDEKCIEEYAGRFLDDALRHAQFQVEDLTLESALPPIVAEFYRAMLAIAEERAHMDDTAFPILVDKLSEYSQLLRPALREWQAAEQKTDLLAERCRQLEAQIASQTGTATQGESINANSARIAELESSLAQIELVLSESEKDIAVLNGQLAELRQLVARRDLEVTEQLASAAALRQSDLVALGISQVQQQRALEDHRAMIAERDALVALNADRADGLAEQLAAARFEIAHGDSRQSQLTLEIERINAELAHLETEVEQRQHAYRCHTLELEIEVGNQQQGRLANAGETQALREQLDAMRNSWVWRWFAPLQDLQLPIRATKAAAMETAIRTYRRLPVSAAAKQRLKNTIFRFSGPLFSRQDSYRRWRAYQEIQPRTEGRTEIDGQGPLNPSEQPLGADNNDQTAMPAHLPTADGGWEWAEYGSTKEHIRRLKNERMARISPKPPSILDVGGESPAAVAAKIHLPPPVEQPHVSIIVPVFNNLRFTLECLWSIAVHDDQRVTYEVIVADDASTDETARICASIPNLRLLRNDSNLGFLRNCNRALAHVRGRFTLYLNNDVQVTRGWLHALADTFERFPGTGAAGPRVIYPSGHLQEAGVAFRPDGGADMIGLNDDPDAVRYSYAREVDYVSGACLMLPTHLAQRLGGFSEDYLPCYCEDGDLCLRVREAGHSVYYNPAATVVHHLSKTTDTVDANLKMRAISTNLATLSRNWPHRLNESVIPKVIAFYLPQFHPFPENDRWWGKGFTEWSNVTSARPNFVGHFQPRVPSDLGFYDLRLPEVMEQQVDLARQYGVHGFCHYYYWFGGKRLLERPIEQMLASGKPDFPFCLCWANENWTRRWDGQDQDVLIAQAHSPDDDIAVIHDLMRYFNDQRYIRISGRPVILVYRVTLFPDFTATARRWRDACRTKGIGEIYIAMVESMELVHMQANPANFGCDASVEFPPQELAETRQPSGQITNPDFRGHVADYRDLAVRFATRQPPGYPRHLGVVTGWDNTARRQNTSYCFEYATPGAFQAWLEEALDQTRLLHSGDARLVFVNAWNEWAEGAYLEPDMRFGHTYLEAVRNALDAALLLRPRSDVVG